MFKLIFRIILIVVVVLIVSQLEYRNRKLKTYALEFFKSFKANPVAEELKDRAKKAADDLTQSHNGITEEDRRQLIEILE